MKPKLIVHGGAWNIPQKLEAAHRQGMENALTTVYPLLRDGLSALDAVEKAVNILEADPTFDAGRGAFLNAAGEIELDAIIVDGTTRNFGAVGALQNVLHPVSVARRVMMDTEHCFLVGAGAAEFARRMGFPELAPEALLTERELSYFRKIRDDPDFRTRLPFEPSPMGTVGAVALDQAGNLAAATSTGGTPRKLPGRVGDTPVIGAGAYADHATGAASATGWGESILKVLLSKTVCDLLPTLGAAAAAGRGIQLLEKSVHGLAGIIAIDRRGNCAFAHNTAKMAVGMVKDSGKVRCQISQKNG